MTESYVKAEINFLHHKKNLNPNQRIALERFMMECWFDVDTGYGKFVCEITKIELAKELHVNRNVAAKVVKELIQFGYIEDSNTKPKSCMKVIVRHPSNWQRIPSGGENHATLNSMMDSNHATLNSISCHVGWHDSETPVSNKKIKIKIDRYDPLSIYPSSSLEGGQGQACELERPEERVACSLPSEATHLRVVADSEIGKVYDTIPKPIKVKPPVSNERTEHNKRVQQYIVIIESEINACKAGAPWDTLHPATHAFLKREGITNRTMLQKRKEPSGGWKPILGSYLHSLPDLEFKKVEDDNERFKRLEKIIVIQVSKMLSQDIEPFLDQQEKEHGFKFKSIRNRYAQR